MIVPRRSWRFSTHVVGGWFSRSRLERFSSATTLRVQGKTTSTENQDPGLGGRLSPRCVGGTVREHKFVATPHAPVPRPVSFPGRPHGECALLQFPNLPPLPFRLSAVPRASSTPPLAPSSLHCAYLPVWPATRLLCPPPRSVLSGMGFWDVGGFAVESVAARVCCEAGARVSVNVRVQDMDLALPDALAAVWR